MEMVRQVNFKDEMEQKVLLIEDILTKNIPKEIGFQKSVIEAMNYSLLAGGKRLRPLFMMETYRMFGGKDTVIENFVTAIEMIHTYSLVHDDLPAMDNDEYRRGRKTTHIVYGEAMGILAGDGLLNYAFEIASAAFDKCRDAAVIGRAIRILSVKAGIYGMIGGQCADIEAVGTSLTKEKIDFIHRLKTGALLEASMMIGAVLAGAGERECEIMEQIAGKIGLAFQIQDDILDINGTAKELGKPVHSDEKNNKTTYVTIVGVDQAVKDVERLSGEAADLLHTLHLKDEFLAELIQSLVYRKK